jgi:hypothetical protein
MLKDAGKTLLKLELDGTLGIAASDRLSKLLDAAKARSIRLKLKDKVSIAPTEEEVHRLCQDPANPLMSAVARKLVSMRDTNPGEREKATLALRELFAAITAA